MRRYNTVFTKKNAYGIMIILGFAFLLLNAPLIPISASPSDNSEVTIFSEDFEGTFPDDNDWAVDDLESNNGNDYWDSTDYRAYNGDNSVWCAQIGERSGWIRFFKEDFEDGFGDGINGWSVGDDEPTGQDAYWDVVDFDFGGEGTNSGDYKGYCAGIGYSGTSSSPEYQNYMEAYMSRTIDLTDYDMAYLAFYHQIISTDIGWDYGQVLVDGAEVERYDTQKLTWTYTSVNLNAYVGDSHEITFNFYSDNIIVDEGWYIDDIKFYGHVPTPRPNSELHNYDNYMEAVMQKEIDLSDYVSANLTYYYWLDIEANYDYLYLETSSDGLSWDTEKSYTGDSFGWESDSVDLTSFSGSSVYIRFLFESDDIINNYEGAYLDDIVITGIPHNDAGSGGDAGDDFDTATETSPGSHEGFLESFDENDYYKIYVSSSNVINVNMTPSSGSNFDLALYDPDEDLLDESTLSGSAMESVSHTAETSGDHYILVSYISGSSTYELEIEIEDHIPPTLTITSPANGTEVKSSTVEITWTGSDLDSGIDHYEVNIEGGTWINVMTSNSYNFSGVGDGSHIVHVKAVDGAENTKEAVVNFTVNTSLILGPGWIDDIAVFGIIILVGIILIIFLLRKRGTPSLTPAPTSPPPSVPPPT